MSLYQILDIHIYIRIYIRMYVLQKYFKTYFYFIFIQMLFQIYIKNISLIYLNKNNFIYYMFKIFHIHISTLLYSIYQRLLYSFYYITYRQKKNLQKMYYLRQIRNSRKAQRQSIRIKNVTSVRILACVILAHAPFEQTLFALRHAVSGRG